MHRGLAPVPGALLLDEFEVLIEHDALLAGERAALPPKHVDLARTLHAYGANRLALRDTAGAAAALREALAIRTARLGAAHPLTRETERLLRGR